MTTKPEDSIFLQRYGENEVALTFIYDRTPIKTSDAPKFDVDVAVVLNSAEVSYLQTLMAYQQSHGLKTYDEWYEIWSRETGMVIGDEDGFRARGINRNTLFTGIEFERRVGMCTTGPKAVDHAE